MDRRQFLKETAFTTGGGLLGLEAARSLHPGKALAESSPKSVRVGIITEPGGQHLSWFTRALGVLDGVEMVAAADESGEFFEKGREYLGPRASEFQTFKDYRRMIGGGPSPPGADGSGAGAHARRSWRLCFRGEPTF